VSTDSATVACTRCGALNGADFKRCIRCNGALDQAVPAQKAARRVPAPRVRGRAPAVVGPGSEPLLGRWSAEQFPATKLMLALNLVVFAFHFLSAYRQSASLGTLLSGGSTLDAIRFGALVKPLVMEEPWRLLSACFVHAGIIHIGFNMMGLVFLGRILEPAIGSVRLIIAYVASGIVGFVLSFLWWAVLGGAPVSVGASGAVYGLFGLLLGFMWRRKDPRWKPLLFRALMYAVILGIAAPIDHAAHIGGALTGGALGVLFAPSAGQPSAVWQRWLAYGCVAACVVSLVLVHFSPYLPYFTKMAAESG
jgi:membrane associated rhomboid family serine protease